MKRLMPLFLIISFLMTGHADAKTNAKAKSKLRRTPKSVTTALPKKRAPAQASSQSSGEDNGGIQANEDGEMPTAQKRPALDTGNAVRVNYGNTAWNKKSTEIDTATVLMREGSTGKIVQLSLVETTPDSSIFSGLYSINWRTLEQTQVEFFIPPQELIGTKAGIKKLAELILGNQLRRNPFIMRRSAQGQQNVEIFDSRDQALLAMKAYRAEMQVTAMQRQGPQKVLTEQDIETAKKAEALRIAQENAKAQVDRVRIEQLEAKRLQDLMAKQALMKESEREERRKQAAVLADEGRALFEAEKFPEAKAKFQQAVDLDPDNRAFYFKYGVALYKLDEFNRSLVLLQMAEGKDVNQLERQYFIGLNYFRMKDYKSSIVAFDKIIEANDPTMSPSAQFYKGVLLFEQQSWEPAQTVFQAVLDTSQDPKLDERAEAYLEQILRIRQFEEEKKRKWLISATLGEMYDENVLLISDSQRDTGAASDLAGYRTLLTGSVRYRPVYDQVQEFSAQLDLMTMYTLDNGFQVDETLRNTDPTVATLTLPWTYKGTAFEKGYKLDVTPGYETTIMSVENNENKPILNSYLLNISNLIVMNPNWFANYNLEIRQDNSLLTSSTGEDDSSAMKVKLSNANLLFVSEDKTRIVTADAGYTLNQAVGRNSVFNRLDLAIGYIMPWKWETSANFKLGYFQLAYPQNPNNRTDNSYTATVGLSRKINEIWSTGFLASYNINGSSVTDNQYKKLTALLTLSSSYGF